MLTLIPQTLIPQTLILQTLLLQELILQTLVLQTLLPPSYLISCRLSCSVAWPGRLPPGGSWLAGRWRHTAPLSSLSQLITGFCQLSLSTEWELIPSSPFAGHQSDHLLSGVTQVKWNPPGRDLTSRQQFYRPVIYCSIASGLNIRHSSNKITKKWFQPFSSPYQLWTGREWHTFCLLMTSRRCN